MNNIKTYDQIFTHKVPLQLPITQSWRSRPIASPNYNQIKNLSNQAAPDHEIETKMNACLSVTGSDR